MAAPTTPAGVGASFLPSCQCSIMSVSLSNNSLPTWEAARLPGGGRSCSCPTWLVAKMSLLLASLPLPPLVERLRQCVPQLHSRLSLARSFCTSWAVTCPGVESCQTETLKLKKNSHFNTIICRLKRKENYPSEGGTENGYNVWILNGGRIFKKDLNRLLQQNIACRLLKLNLA